MCPAGDVCASGPCVRGEPTHCGRCSRPRAQGSRREPELHTGPRAQLPSGNAELSPRVPESKVMPSLGWRGRGDEPLEVQKPKCQHCHQRSVTLGEPLDSLGL